MSGWTRVKVEELAAPTPNALATGPFGSSISSKFFVERGVPVIRGSNLSENVGLRLSDENLVFIEPEKAATFSRSEVRRGDLVFTCWGTIGQVGLVDQRAGFERYIVSNKQMKLTPDPSKADSLFLYFAFSSPMVMAAIQGQTIGSSVPGFNLGQLRNIELDLPPLDEQRRIAAVLGALDDKIELNRKMNRTLEEMAQAIFKSWFIDFDGHDDLVDSEIGPVPRGWGVGTLGDLADLNPESWNKRTRPAAISYVDLSNTKWGAIEAVTEFQAGDAPSRAQRVLRPRDTIVGTVRPGNGSYALVARSGLTGSTGFAVLRPKDPESASMIYLAATRRENIDRLAHLADGGAYPAVRPEIVAATPTVVPPAAALAGFAANVDPLLQRVATNRAESRTLAELRDTLLPKLISGELRVPEAEERVEAAS